MGELYVNTTLVGVMKVQRKFDLNLLRVFISAYQTESVTKAAEQLDLTQSAVSNALARLKEQVGGDLFIRTGRGIKPTRFAQDLYQSIQSPLMEVESMLQGINQFDPKTSTRRFLVYCHEAQIHVLRQRFDQSLIDMSIDVVLMEPPSNEERLYEELQLEKVDLVIDVEAPQSKVFRSTLLKEDHLCCVVRKGHSRLFKQALSKVEYLQEKHVLLKMRRSQLPFLDWFVKEVVPVRQIYSQHSSLIGMLAAVSYSDAVAVVPVTFAQQYQQVFQLNILPFPFEDQLLKSHMVWLSKMNLNPANQWLRHFISTLTQ